MLSGALVKSLEGAVDECGDAGPEGPPIVTVLSEVVPALVFEDAVLHGLAAVGVVSHMNQILNWAGVLVDLFAAVVCVWLAHHLNRKDQAFQFRWESITEGYEKSSDVQDVLDGLLRYLLKEKEQFGALSIELASFTEYLEGVSRYMTIVKVLDQVEKEGLGSWRGSGKSTFETKDLVLALLMRVRSQA